MFDAFEVDFVVKLEKLLERLLSKSQLQISDHWKLVWDLVVFAEVHEVSDLVLENFADESIDLEEGDGQSLVKS